MKLLLHACCAPCSVACIAALRDEGIEPALFWYNPNIHPLTEYVNRRDALTQYAKSLGLPLIMEDDYGLRDFLYGLKEQAPERSSFDAPRRCAFCYSLRMERTAAVAKEKGFDAFCTTLFISPYQNHELLREQAAAAAEQSGTALLYRDFRPRFREGRQEARRLGLYMQKYCGCIFSEEERGV
jgi:predicted adenine nucleotide alpha hydrolase (AANH) superfamily ATPase